MFALVVVCFVLFHDSGAIPAPGHGALLGYCDTSSQCAPDECCVSFNQPRGRRYVPDTLDPNLMSLVHGSCQKRGTNTTNSRCLVNGLKPSSDGLYYTCPCLGGFVCEGTGVHEVPLGEIGQCTTTPQFFARPARAGTSCNTGADCPDNECCVTSNRPIGRRDSKRFFMQSTCQPMGTTGSGCFVNQGSGKPDTVTYQCPCSSGLTCHGSGMFDVPLGEVGKCGA